MTHSVNFKRAIATVLIAICALFFISSSFAKADDYSAKEIKEYQAAVAALPDEEARVWLEKAREYNRNLAKKRITEFEMDDEDLVIYKGMLNVRGDGQMAYVEIPKISVSLPIYHGTSEKVLKDAVGHIEWSSLPVGGESSHCTISAHRGLPSAKLFTNIDKLGEGDIFYIKVLGESLEYKIISVMTVLPEETEALEIESGRDLCTLMTCTPYGINTHRLYVTGERVWREE